MIDGATQFMAFRQIILPLTLPGIAATLGFVFTDAWSELLFALMLVRTPLPSALGDTTDGLMRHLSLLFVPAGVGVVQHLDRLGADGVRLIAVVVLTTLFTLAVTALVFEVLARLMGVDEIPPDRKGGGAT